MKLSITRSILIRIKCCCTHAKVVTFDISDALCDLERCDDSRASQHIHFTTKRNPEVMKSEQRPATNGGNLNHGHGSLPSCLVAVTQIPRPSPADHPHGPDFHYHWNDRRGSSALCESVSYVASSRTAVQIASNTSGRGTDGCPHALCVRGWSCSILGRSAWGIQGVYTQTASSCRAQLRHDYPNVFASGKLTRSDDIGTGERVPCDDPPRGS